MNKIKSGHQQARKFEFWSYKYKKINFHYSNKKKMLNAFCVTSNVKFVLFLCHYLDFLISSLSSSLSFTCSSLIKQQVYRQSGGQISSEPYLWLWWKNIVYQEGSLLNLLGVCTRSTIRGGLWPMLRNYDATTLIAPIDTRKSCSGRHIVIVDFPVAGWLRKDSGTSSSQLTKQLLANQAVRRGWLAKSGTGHL